MTAAQPRSPRAAGLLGDRGVGSSVLQVLTSVTLVVVGFITIRPLSWDVTVLLLLNSLLILGRHVTLPHRPRLAVLLVGAVASAALAAEAGHGSSYLFAYYVSGNAGYRLDRDRALAVAGLAGLLNAIALGFDLGPGVHNAPWFVGALAALPVLLGMTNRSHDQALTSAVEAADSARRATDAEARAAVLAERGRIARDVHDVLAHSLAGINMQLEVTDALLEAGEVDRAREAARRAQSLVREGLLESQRTVRALREDTLPLIEALRAMLTSSGHVDGPAVSGEVREVDTRSAQQLIRIAQEALTNATRHAAGAAVAVHVAYEPRTVTLTVTNAPGSGGPGLTGSGMGLVGMRERAALLGGTVSVGPTAGGGWRVEAIIPA